MELKLAKKIGISYTYAAFNQTRMELKQSFWLYSPPAVLTFNQTRMELKQKIWLWLPIKNRSFNQTRMELKLSL